MVLFVVLLCISLIMCDVEHLFMHLLAICLSSLKKSLFSPLQHVFIGSIIFPEMSFRSCLYIFEINSLLVDSVQLLSHIRLFVTPRMAALQSSLSITNTRSSLKLMSIESMMPSSHLILCRPLLLPQSLPSSESFPMSQLFS